MPGIPEVITTERFVREPGGHQDVLIECVRTSLMEFLHVAGAPDLRVDLQKIVLVVDAAVGTSCSEPEVHRNLPHGLFFRSPESGVL